jgi:hypothetical protein
LRRPINGYLDTTAGKQDGLGGEQNTIAAHIDGLTGPALVAGALAQDLVPQIALDRESVGRAPLARFFSVLHFGLT